MSSSIFNSKKNLMNSKIKLFNSLKIIDQAMNRQQFLFEFTGILKVYFRFQLLVIIATAFIIIVFDSYYLLEVFNNPKEVLRLSRADTAAYLSYRLLLNALNVIGLVIACELLKKTSKFTATLVNKIIIASSTQQMRERVLNGGAFYNCFVTCRIFQLVQFSLQIAHNKIKITAFDLFPIDGSLIYSIIAGWTLSAFVGDDIHNNYKAKKDAQIRLNSASVIFSTCSAAGVGFLRLYEESDFGDDDFGKQESNNKNRQQKFDVVIVDEASQITEPNALIPIVKNSSFVVLVGDHEQLQPTVSEIAKEGGLETSLFERLYTDRTVNSKKIMLNVQYRMHKKLADFPSKTFYEGKLFTGVKDEDRIIPNSKFPWPLKDGVIFPAVFIDCHTLENYALGSTSRINIGQSKTTMDIINALREGESADNQQSITVLSPYTKQVIEIRQKLSGSKTKVEVHTIDSFKGRESDIIIYSSVVANASHRLGFLDDHRRMNVALTRAKYGLIFIGHKRTLISNNL